MAKSKVTIKQIDDPTPPIYEIACEDIFLSNSEDYTDSGGDEWFLEVDGGSLCTDLEGLNNLYRVLTEMKKKGVLQP